MKLSAYHKQQGDIVEWYQPFTEKYDRVYISKIFSFSPDYEYVINANEVIRGGTGYEIKTINNREIYSPLLTLPFEIEHTYPDYDLYGVYDTAYGFLTRGCPRGCDFCVVTKKEGCKSIKVADINEFWSGQKNIVLCDANILACPEWRDLFDQLAETKSYIDFNQGLDIRLMTQEKAEYISRCKIKEIHFAWDRYEDKELIVKKLQLFAEKAPKRHGHRGIVYTIVNFNTSFEQDLERIYTLREMEYWPYVMIYNKKQCDNKYKRLQRWVNNRIIFSKCERFEDYK